MQIKKADKEGALSASLNRIGSLIIPDILRLKVHRKEKKKRLSVPLQYVSFIYSFYLFIF